MSGPERPGDVPADLPPEYADAFRRGYDSARERGGAHARVVETEQTSVLGSLESAFKTVPDGEHRSDPHHGQRRRLLVPLVLVGLSVLLVLSAYGIGRLFSSEISAAETASPEPESLVIAEDGASAGEDEEQQSKAPEQGEYDGQVAPTAIGGATASCQSAGSVDATGRRIRYAPGNIYDGDQTTAWRCDGSGAGETVTIELPEETTIGEVGIVPGYAKTDPASGADRYAENNRITGVRWSFSDGSSVTQDLDGAPTNRALQAIRIPETDTDQVVIEILRSAPGPRDTVAISDVQIGAVTG